MTDDTPFTKDVARALLKGGWSPLPLPARAKSSPPSGFTGYRGKYVTAQDVERWDYDGNLAIRLPPDVVGVDVDVYHGGRAGLDDLMDRYGVLPATAWSTSREDGSGIGLFRVPVGTTLATDPAPGVDMIQAHHRYMVVWPSIHPEGRVYQWIDEFGEYLEGPPDIDDLPELPWQWIEGLSVTKSEAARAATPGECETFLGACTESNRPAAINGVRKRLEMYSGARHDTLVKTACWLMRETAAGYYPATVAIDELWAWWSRVMDDPERRDGGEFGAAIMWAVAQAQNEPDRIAAMRTAPTTSVAKPPPNVDPVTGQILPMRNLPDEFWNARPVLGHIRQAAHSRFVSADAVLATVLARVIMLTPPTVTLPAIVGSRVSLNIFTSIVDAAGGGKSASVAVGSELVQHSRTDIADPILPSSGEGLIEAFMGFVDAEGDDGKKRKERKQVMTAGMAWVDEGQGLLAQGERSGSTIMETIRSAWMGGDLGQHNATEERKRWLKAHQYRLTMIVGFQLKYAATLIADGEGGTPQRFTFMHASDPNIEPDIAWPGPLDWRPPPTMSSGMDIGFHPDIVAGIRQRRLDRSRGILVVDPLDTHADLRKMKLAAAFALLDGRQDVELEDWWLAEMVDGTSCAVRTMAVEYASSMTSAARRLAVAMAVEREATTEAAALQRKLLRVARNVSRKVWREGQMTPAKAVRALTSRDRDIDSDDVIAVAVDNGWLTWDGFELARGGKQP